MTVIVIGNRTIDFDRRCKDDMPIGTCSLCLGMSEEIPYAVTYSKCVRCDSQINPGDAIVRVKVKGRTRLIGECCG